MDPLVPISALEHWSYCPRQCGLIHVESVWDENIFTIKGNYMHERADDPTTRFEKGIKVERALPVWNDSLGIFGRCDIVEFHGKPNQQIVPVEYKVGDNKHQVHASVQLCAQVLCLESMFKIPIESGALYFGKTKARINVRIDLDLRVKTLMAINEVRSMIQNGSLPPPAADRRCPKCSLIDACIPRVVHSAMTHLSNLYQLQSERELP
jgi:CRISPR-associated exonuclease Cas4